MTVMQQQKETEELTDRSAVRDPGKYSVCRLVPPAFRPDAWSKSRATDSPSKQKLNCWSELQEKAGGKYMLPNIVAAAGSGAKGPLAVNRRPAERVSDLGLLTPVHSQLSSLSQAYVSNQDPPRSISSVRSQEALLAHPFLSPAKAVATSITTKVAANKISTSHKKKLRLLIGEGGVRERNRSVSIESGNTSPDCRFHVADSRHPTDGSSNERTSEESRKPIQEARQPQALAKCRTSRKSLISPPSLEPRMAQPYVEVRKQLQSRVISSMAKVEVLRKNFATAQAHNEDLSNVSSFAVPDDESYRKIVTFTKSLKHAFVAAYVRGVPKSRGEAKTIAGRTAETPQGKSEEPSWGSNKLFVVPRRTGTRTGNPGDLAQRQHTISSGEDPMQITSFGKYLQLRPEFGHDNNKSPATVGAERSPLSQGELNFSSAVGRIVSLDAASPTPQSGSKSKSGCAAGYESVRCCGTRPVAEESVRKAPSQKAFRIVRKLIRAPTEVVLDIPKETAWREPSPQADTEGIAEVNDDSNLTVSKMDCSEMKEQFHVQKGENISLFAALAADYNGGPVRLAVHPVILVDPVDIQPEVPLGY